MREEWTGRASDQGKKHRVLPIRSISLWVFKETHGDEVSEWMIIDERSSLYAQLAVTIGGKPVEPSAPHADDPCFPWLGAHVAVGSSCEKEASLSVERTRPSSGLCHSSLKPLKAP